MLPSHLEMCASQQECGLDCPVFQDHKCEEPSRIFEDAYILPEGYSVEDIIDWAEYYEIEMPIEVLIYKILEKRNEKTNRSDSGN